ncbi:MAG: hypothetical protein CK527_06985, partial [Nitrosarchaeum sp.]
SFIFHRGEKTPWSFTAACACGIVKIAQGIWELCLTFPGMLMKQRCNTRLFLQYHLSREDWRHVQVGSSAGAAPL